MKYPSKVSRLHAGGLVSTPNRDKRFFPSLCIHAISEAHPSTCVVCTWNSYPGSKQRCETDY